MTSEYLKGRRILVAEDEYLIADDLRTALTAAGAEVIGPWPTVSDALNCLECETDIDAAVLDVNLRGDMIFPVADLLNSRGVPFIFATGYDQWSLPDRFVDAVRLEKPLKPERVMEALGLTTSTDRHCGPDGPPDHRRGAAMCGAARLQQPGLGWLRGTLDRPQSPVTAGEQLAAAPKKTKYEAKRKAGEPHR